MKKLMVADYDGTFYRHNDKEIQRNIETVKKWREAGNIFAFATGRDVINIKYEYDRFGVEYDYLVGVNGAFVADNENNILLKKTIDKKVARDIVEMLREDSKGQLLVQNGIAGCYRVNYIEGDERIEFLYKKTKALYKHTPEEALEEDVVSVGCMADDFGVAKKLNDEVIKKYGDVVESFNNLTYVNVVPKNTSKATGIQIVADKYNISKENIFVIGDNLNDLEMITVYNGVTLDNGREEVKAVASKVVSSVADFIEEKF